MNIFSKKIVWITGASSGIGEALAYAFANEGAQLILSARRMDELERVKNNCNQNETIELLQLDLSNVEELVEKVQLVIQKMGQIDILINNAGISQRSIATETSMDVYRKIMEVNFFGAIALTKSVLPYFIKKNEGQFVTISSVAGIIGLPLRTAYCSSKYAIEGFFSSLRIEIWKTNIRILMVRPAAVKTNIAQNALNGDGSRFNKKDRVIEKGIDPSSVAATILQALRKNKKELIIGSWKEKMLSIVNSFAPSIVFNAVKKYTP